MNIYSNTKEIMGKRIFLLALIYILSLSSITICSVRTKHVNLQVRQKKRRTHVDGKVTFTDHQARKVAQQVKALPKKTVHHTKHLGKHLKKFKF